MMMLLSSLLLLLAATAVAAAAVYFDFVNSSLYVRNVSSFVRCNQYLSWQNIVWGDEQSVKSISIELFVYFAHMKCSLLF